MFEPENFEVRQFAVGYLFWDANLSSFDNFDGRNSPFFKSGQGCNQFIAGELRHLADFED